MKNSAWAVLAAVLWMAMPAGGDPGDERILLAKDAARTGDRNRLALNAPPTGHVLDPYPEYWALSNQLARAGDVDFERIRDFLQRNAGSWAAEKLRSEWLRNLGKRGEFGPLLADLIFGGLELGLAGAKRGVGFLGVSNSPSRTSSVTTTRRASTAAIRPCLKKSARSGSRWSTRRQAASRCCRRWSARG